MSRAEIGLRVLVEVSETDAGGSRRDFYFIGTLEEVHGGRAAKLSFRREDTHELVMLNGRIDGLFRNPTSCLGSVSRIEPRLRSN